MSLQVNSSTNANQTAAPVDVAYRADLDGLRAIAVWLVILNHAGFGLLPGGFVGVDVFFVLSGFLISSLIMQQLSTGKFSFQTFYLRRFRRLLPAFLVIAAISFALSYRYLLPGDFILNARMLGLALLSLGNFYLANVTDGYFAADEQSIPLMHTWSLAVEEQFYLLWPLCLVVIYRLFKPGKLFVPFAIATLVLAGFSQWYSDYDPIRGYFLLPARAFELMMGATIAAGIQTLPRLRPAAAATLSLFGLALITLSALTLSGQSLFPGFNALWPCLGTAILIYAGRYPNAVKSMLSRKAVVWMGKISYSLYLWHWIVIAYISYVALDFTLPLRMSAIALTVVLSHLTWRYVEIPFRFSYTMTFRKTLLSLLVLPALAFSAIAVTVANKQGMPSRFGSDELAAQAIETDPRSYPPKCTSQQVGKVCGEILLLGDSYARQYQDFVQVFARDAGMEFTAIIKVACPPLRGARQQADNPLQQACYQHNQLAYKAIGHQRYVILGSYWNHSLDLSAGSHNRGDEADGPTLTLDEIGLRQGLFDSVKTIVDHGAIPVIIKDIPVPISYHCLVTRIVGYNTTPCDIPTAEVEQRQLFVNNTLAELQGIYPQLVLIDPKKILCNSNTCSPELQGIPLYIDDKHLNGPGSRLLGETYLRVFGNPLGHGDAKTKKP